MNTKEILTSVCEASYTYGKDNETLLKIKEIISPYCEKTETDALGNLICTVKSKGKKHVLLSAHMDKISLVVTAVDKSGMLKTATAGGIDIRILAAARVKVIGKEILSGCVTSTPPHLSSGDKNKAVPANSLFVDCGLSFEEISKIVSPGDLIQYDSPVTALLDDKLSGAYMDNCAGCTAVINAVKELKNQECNNKITAVFTTREEIGKQGAAASGGDLRPDYAFITDVSFGTAPGIPEESSSQLSSGAMICKTPILQKEVSDFLVKIATDNDIPHTIEVTGSRTATDADVFVNSGTGVKTGLVSIPLLNMHTPVETLSLKDIEAVGKILALASKEVK